ncbi:hypothetical protein Sjap_009650 [Stephania japonica]|uniref:Pentatricopeptide repeat-containing protein n=1 Tax=Stephania japonica TaxID=461633 RepID=A0AAP0J828_9MAGN
MWASVDGELVHAHVIKLGFAEEAVIATSIVVMYGVFGKLECARRVFDESSERDLVMWNAVVVVCAQSKVPRMAIEVLRSMIDENVRPNGLSIFFDLPTQHNLWKLMTISGCCTSRVSALVCAMTLLWSKQHCESHEINLFFISIFWELCFVAYYLHRSTLSPYPFNLVTVGAQWILMLFENHLMPNIMSTTLALSSWFSHLFRGRASRDIAFYSFDEMFTQLCTTCAHIIESLLLPLFEVVIDDVHLEEFDDTIVYVEMITPNLFDRLLVDLAGMQVGWKMQCPSSSPLMTGRGFPAGNSPMGKF